MIKTNLNLILSIIQKQILKFSAVLLLIGALGLIIASFVTNRDTPRVFAVEASTINQSITATELATWFIENKQDFEILDLRPALQYKQGHIKGAMSCPVCHLNKKDAKQKMDAGQVMPNFAKKIVVYTNAKNKVLFLPRIIATHEQLFQLVGGYEAWQEQVLKQRNFTITDTPKQILAKKRANAISNFFTGKRVVAPPVKNFKKIIKRKHIISSGANEGC